MARGSKKLSGATRTEVVRATRTDIRGESRGMRAPKVPIPASIDKDGGFQPNFVKTQIAVLVKGYLKEPHIKWAEWPEEQKNEVWEQLLLYYSFSDNVIAQDCFEVYVKYSYKQWMNKARKDAIKAAGATTIDHTCVTHRPTYIPEIIWSQMIDKWMDPKWASFSKKASENRNKTPLYIPYTGGSRTVERHRKAMCVELGRDPNRSELFKRTHRRAATKDWVNSRVKEIGDMYVQHMVVIWEKLSQQHASDDSIPSMQGSCMTPTNTPIHNIEDWDFWGETSRGLQKGRVLGYGTKELGPRPTKIVPQRPSDPMFVYPPSIQDLDIPTFTVLPPPVPSVEMFRTDTGKRLFQDLLKKYMIDNRSEMLAHLCISELGERSDNHNDSQDELVENLEDDENLASL